MADTLALLGHYPPWMDDAACAEVGGDWWFPERGGSSRQAKRICRLCAVTSTCLQFALENGIDHGTWGGLTERERRRLKRRIAAGEPT